MRTNIYEEINYKPEVKEFLLKFLLIKAQDEIELEAVRKSEDNWYKRWKEENEALNEAKKTIEELKKAAPKADAESEAGENA